MYVTARMAAAVLAVIPSAAAYPRPYIPALASASRKGQHGRVVVVGGSEEYTGAPYYAGISALKTGADLAHVLCAREAATAIKAYSPELIVHPIFGSDSEHRDLGAEAAAARSILSRADSVVFGPGLGRSPATLEVVGDLIRWTAARSMPTVIDGDALWLLAQNPELIAGHCAVVLTPNGGEFVRLWHAVYGGGGADPPAGREGAAALARLLLGNASSAPPAFIVSAAVGGAGASGDAAVAVEPGSAAPPPTVAVLRKGVADDVAVARAAAVSSDDAVPLELALTVGDAGSPRRCGGQGDVLAGVLGTLLAWAARAPPPASSAPPPPPDALAACAVSASRVTRAAASTAFAAHGRAMTTPDLIACLGRAFQAVHPD